MDIQAWIRDLPKAEHHLHIEGTISWAMVCESSDSALPEQAGWLAKDYRFDDFTDFGKVIGMGVEQVLVNLEDYHRIAHYHFQQLAEQNVRYVETSFGFNIAINRGIAVADVVKTIRNAAPENMTVCVFGAFHRDEMLSDELAQDVLNTPDLAGIDLHGDERVDISLEHYAEIYDEARRLGLRTKAHAGELRDSSSVVEILEKLRPQRIQHGVTAAKDAAVLALLAEQQIILDMCPTSNVRLRVVPNIRSYPIRTFLEHDIEVTINTDDPSIFGCTLSGELSAMIEHKLLSLSEIVSLQSQAFARADIDETVRSAVEAELEVCLAKLEI